MRAPDAERANTVRARLRAFLAMAFAGAIWLTTWIVPVTFMVAMAWACEVHARQLGRRTLAFYDGSAATTEAAIAVTDSGHEPGHTRRQIVRSAILVLSIAIPIGFVAYANHVRQSTGINWLAAIGALVALSLVIAASIAGSRR